MTADGWQLVANTVGTRMDELGLSQSDVATRAGLSHSVISDLQRGRPKNYQIATLIHAARGLELHPFALIEVLARSHTPEPSAPQLAHEHLADLP